MTAARTLRRLGAAAGLALAVASPALAQTPPDPKLKVARELIEVSGAAASYNGIVAIFFDEAKRSLLRTQPPEFGKDFDAVIKILQPEFEQRHEQLLNEIARVYVDRFSEAELNDIKTFYQSASGRKLAQVQPSVQQAVFQKVSVWSSQMSQDIISRSRAEMKKKGRNI